MEARSLAQRREPFVFVATEAIFALQCYTIASISFLYYDHLITFPQEVRKIWKRRLSFLNVLFIINRYTTCFGYIPIMYFTFKSPTNTDICDHYVIFPAILSIITQAIISIIVTLRCYALYNRSRWILYSVSLLGLAVLGSFIWAATAFVGISLNFGGIYRTCVPDLVSGENFPYKVAWGLSIIFDGVVFGLTLYRTLQMMKVHKIRGTYGSLANLILRDGSVYFVVMAVSYIIHISLFFSIENSFFADSAGNNAFLTHTISVTMMSRLILNLNSYGERHTRRRTSIRPNPREGLQPSTQFTTHVTNYSSWIARTAQEFSTDFESDASTGLTFSAGSGPTEDVFVSDDEYMSRDNDIEMTVRSRRNARDVTNDDGGDGAPTRDSGSGWWWSAEDERNEVNA